MKIYQVLNELTRPSQNKADEILNQHGYQQLGKGMYAKVYGHPDKPFVLKLFGGGDIGYLNYLKLILSTPNQHFPVVKGKPMRVTGDYWAVQLEKLEPTSNYNVRLGSLAATYCEQYMLLHDEEHRTASEHKFNQSVEREVPRPNYTQITWARQSMTTFEKHYPDFAEALRLVADKVLIPGASYPDLHPGNFMQRGTVLVITDPVSDSSQKEPDQFPTTKSPQPTLPFAALPRDSIPNYRELPDKLPPELYPSQPNKRAPELPGLYNQNLRAKGNM